MDMIVAILKDFTDRELAFFYKYRLQQYTTETQEEIVKYIILTRKISVTKIEKIITSPPPKNGLCRRCGSDRVFSYDVQYRTPIFKKMYYSEWLELSKKFFMKRQVECSICCNIIENPNETYFDKIIKFIKGN